MRRATCLLAVFAVIASACSAQADSDAAPPPSTEVSSTTQTTPVEPFGESTDVDAGDEGEAEVEVVSEQDPFRDFRGTTIKVEISVREPPEEMEEIIALTEELFTAETGIIVEYVPDQRFVNDVIYLTPPTPADVRLTGSFEAAQFGVNGWLEDLTPRAVADADFDLDDLIPSVRSANSLDESLFAVPFFAESSIIMYNQQIMDASGIDFPEAPMWEQVAAIARQVDTDDVPGICLRGLPGWGDLGSSLTTVVNTFGGTWWEATSNGTPGEPQINQPDSGFREATEFYIDLLRDAGQSDPEQSSRPQCLEQFQNGEAAIFYDGTVVTTAIESEESQVAGNVGYALAPVNLTESSGWLWTWGLAIPTDALNPDAAWEYVSWATSAEFVRQAGENSSQGWLTAPRGTRLSTYEIPEYLDAHEPYADLVLRAITEAPIDMPGTTQRPGLPGVQYVGIPEFQDSATRCTTEVAEAIANVISIDQALDRCQSIALEVSDIADVPSRRGGSTRTR